MSAVFFVVTAVCLLLLVSGAYVFVVACVRNRGINWLDKNEVDKTAYAKYYPNIVAADQWLKAHDAQEVYTTSHDGLKLHAYWVPAPNPKGTVLFAHGYRSTFLVDFSHALSYYHDMGMNLLLPDQRSHGKSEGRFITFGVKESTDMEQWIAFHNEELCKLPVVLSGLSMGASTMLYLADQKLPENVRGVIADCGFTSPKDILISVYKRVIHLPAVPTIWVVELLTRMVAGFSLYAKDTRKILSRNRLPVLMIHGTQDHFVPCEMSQEGYDACSGNKHLLLVENADHGVSFLVDKDRYSNAVINFIKTYIISE